MSMRPIVCGSPIVAHVDPPHGRRLDCVIEVDNADPWIPASGPFHLRPAGAGSYQAEIFAYTLEPVNVASSRPLAAASRVSLCADEERWLQVQQTHLTTAETPSSVFMNPEFPREDGLTRYSDEVEIQTDNGYVAVDVAGVVEVVTGEGRSRWQVLNPHAPASTAPIPADGELCLLSPNGRFLSLAPGSIARAQRQSPGPYEVFRVVVQ